VLDSNGVKQPSLLTTPDVLSLHESLAALRDADAAYVVLEASSIGLDQNRLDGVSIDFAVFTNLSREHLDYHGDMDAYAQAKALLFACPGIELALINLDDRRAQQMRAATHDCAVMTYGIQDQSANVRAAHITFEPTGVRFDLLVGRQSAGVQTPIVGDYNLSNLLAVAGVLSHLQIELPDTRTGPYKTSPRWRVALSALLHHWHHWHHRQIRLIALTSSWIMPIRQMPLKACCRRCVLWFKRARAVYGVWWVAAVIGMPASVH